MAARSYAYTHLVSERERPYDMLATVLDQVYGGADAEVPIADRAVVGTTRIVLTYNGHIINAPYHSTCGGSTCCRERGVEGGRLSVSRRRERSHSRHRRSLLLRSVADFSMDAHLRPVDAERGPREVSAHVRRRPIGRHRNRALGGDREPNAHGARAHPRHRHLARPFHPPPERHRDSCFAPLVARSSTAPTFRWRAGRIPMARSHRSSCEETGTVMGSACVSGAPLGARAPARTTGRSFAPTIRGRSLRRSTGSARGTRIVAIAAMLVAAAAPARATEHFSATRSRQASPRRNWRRHGAGVAEHDRECAVVRDSSGLRGDRAASARRFLRELLELALRRQDGRPIHHAARAVALQSRRFDQVRPRERVDDLARGGSSLHADRCARRRAAVHRRRARLAHRERGVEAHRRDVRGECARQHRGGDQRDRRRGLSPHASGERWRRGSLHRAQGTIRFGTVRAGAMFHFSRPNTPKVSTP